jgi:UDP-3-O-[3-hydroxymyristoyl] N-acetylglucosamine deacetylase/3-hydroxyacyl-[acyl-carrier-protein] dehydratase
MNQTTILNESFIEGIGLHSGVKSCVIFKPAPFADYGIRFARTDLANKFEIEAIWYNAIVGLETRGSVLEKSSVKIYTIEHIMSSCYAIGIDNLLIEINNIEVPILDGSAKKITDILIKCGIKEFDVKKEYYILKKPLHFVSGKTKISAYPCDHLEIECTIGFDNSLLKFQKIFMNDLNKDKYINDFASARTFCFYNEIEKLKKKGLALGGSLKNAIVIGEDKIYNKEPLRYKDEFVRHKVLDLIGDLYLIGKPIKARIVAEKPGHQNNIDFIIEFLKEAVIEKNKIIKEDINKKKFDLKKTEKILTLNEILKYIPHRYPFLMIDKVKIDVFNSKKAVGYKCVTGNEYFFQGHFPGNPIMPGVLIVEAMAQTSCVMFLSRPEVRGKLAYFLSITKAKFRKPVIPGDLLKLNIEVIKNSITRGKVKGNAYVNDKLVAEAEFMFIIINNKIDN